MSKHDPHGTPEKINLPQTVLYIKMEKSTKSRQKNDESIRHPFKNRFYTKKHWLRYLHKMLEY